MSKSSSAPVKNKVNNFQRIRELSKKQQSLLSLMLLERMKPNYQLFVDLTEFEQPYVLDNLTNSLWQKVLLAGTKVSLSAMENKIEEMTPDVKDFDMYGVYPAVYFCTALLTYINGEASEDEYDAVAVAKISQGAIVHLIEYQTDGEADNAQIREHELMQLEMQFLTDSMDWLETVNFKNSEANQLQTQAIEKALADGVTNIGIEI